MFAAMVVAKSTGSWLTRPILLLIQLRSSEKTSASPGGREAPGDQRKHKRTAVRKGGKGGRGEQREGGGRGRHQGKEGTLERAGEEQRERGGRGRQ